MKNRNCKVKKKSKSLPKVLGKTSLNEQDFYNPLLSSKTDDLSSISEFLYSSSDSNFNNKVGTIISKGLKELNFSNNSSNFLKMEKSINSGEQLSNQNQSARMKNQINNTSEKLFLNRNNYDSASEVILDFEECTKQQNKNPSSSVNDVEIDSSFLDYMFSSDDENGICNINDANYFIQRKRRTEMERENKNNLIQKKSEYYNYRQ